MLGRGKKFRNPKKPKWEPQWQTVGNRPKDNSYILFEWHGRVRSGRFWRPIAGGSIAWLISPTLMGRMIIPLSEIKQWAYQKGEG